MTATSRLDAHPTELLRAGATACAATVQAGHVSALELCEAAISRIEQLDGAINAVVVRDFERAREQARSADATRARGERLPLLGVPMTVKESFNVAGLPTSWGLPPFADFVPQQDAVAVQRLKAAGAVILGKTNVPTVLGDWQCANPVYGRSMHPLDARRTPGGSSGGAAAALAAGMVALELGSDLMGSIRVPANFCGVYGHKPSAGVVAARGHAFPRTDAPPGELAGVCGPLARNADDLMLALDVLAGPDAPEATAWRLALPPPRHAGLAGHRVLVLAQHPLAPVSAALRDAIDRCAARLEAAGVQVAHTSARLPDMTGLHATYDALVSTQLAAQQPDAGRSALDAYGWLGLMQQRGAARAQWGRFFTQFDAVLCPSFGCVAFEHIDDADMSARRLLIDGQATDYGLQAAWASIASLAGLPATAAPIDRDADGLPIGVQIVGPYLEDRTPIHLAGLLAGLVRDS